MQECNDSRLRIDTMTKTIRTAELDSKASRLVLLEQTHEALKVETLDLYIVPSLCYVYTTVVLSLHSSGRPF